MGRVRDRLDAFGPRRLCTAGAVRAATRFDLARRSGHFAPTSRSVWGADQVAEPPALPCQGPAGDRQAKRPDLTPCLRATRGVERAVPMGGQRDAGQAAAKPRKTTRFSESAQRMAHQGVPPGASRSLADAALVPEDQRAARGAPWCSTRFPATESAGERVRGEAVARARGEEGGGRAPTPATRHRPGTF